MQTLSRFAALFLCLAGWLLPTSYANAVLSMIATSIGHTCVLTQAGVVKCLGGKDFADSPGILGSANATPVVISGLGSGVKAISVAYKHACAITRTNGVKCWGSNDAGQLGDGTSGADRLEPVDVVGLSSGVKAIAAGYLHTCALTTVGAVKCWGHRPLVGSNDTILDDGLTPVAVTGLSSGVIAIAAGRAHTCALTSTGAIKCWGDNLYGELGNTAIPADAGSLIPVSVNGLNGGIKAIAVGFMHTCALTTTGVVKCWGYNPSKGEQTFAERSTPMTVGHLTGVTAIVSGTAHDCALINTGAVKCWGDNSNAQLGNNSTITSLVPVDVYGLSSGITMINARGAHNCVLTSEGTIKCWGWNQYEQLGNSNYVRSSTPVLLNVPPYVKQAVTFYSIGSKDGWLLESSETSTKGGKANPVSTTLILGDSLKNQQYRSVLHFDTASLPDNAVITKATLTMKKQSLKGGVASLGSIIADIHQKNFGTSASLAANDFEAVSDKTSIATFKASGSTYNAIISNIAEAYISQVAATQFKLHYTKDDNNDKSDDYLKFYSGDSSKTSRPALTIEYFVP